MGGVAPWVNVLVKAGGALVAIPRLILAKGGMAVLVSKGGREVMVAEASMKTDSMNTASRSNDDQRTHPSDVYAEHAIH